MTDLVEAAVRGDASAADLAKEILIFIEARRHVTFAELARKWPDDFAEGQLMFGRPTDPECNIWLWIGLTERGCDAMDLAWPELRFKTDPGALCYLADGMLLRMPLAKRPRRYAKPHWLPVTMNVKQRVPRVTA